MSGEPAVRRRVAVAAGLAVVLATVAGLALAGCSSHVAPPPPPAPGSRPNIVLIMTDDMSLAELRYLPRTRKLLADQGVTFTDFLAPQPLCCPSRAQMLTGQYAQNNGVRHNTGPLGGYQAFHPETALPVWLQAAGYRTAMIGKYLNGYPVDHPAEVGWDHWDPTIEHIYDYYGYEQYADGSYTHPDEYHTDYVAQQSEQVIDQWAGPGGTGSPFFLWTSFVAPHGVCKLVDEADNCYHPPRTSYRYRSWVHEPGLTLSLPSFDERYMGDKPGFLRRRAPEPVHRMQHLQMKRADALLSVDDGVAGIVRALRQTHQLSNTLLVFTSDNGYLMGQHRYDGKILGYEEAVRVPLLMRGLGLPGGTVDHATTAMIDLAPTFAALAGATPRVTVDGEPIVVREQQAHPPPDRTMLIQAGVTNLRRYPDGWWYRGVRTHRYTYIAWTLGFRELYDRRRDPYQDHSVAGDPRYAAIQAELDRRTQVLGACAGDSCRTDFGPLPAVGASVGSTAGAR